MVELVFQFLSLSDFYFVFVTFLFSPSVLLSFCTLHIPTGTELLAAHERNKEKEGLRRL
jgi:hypothetical protein